MTVSLYTCSYLLQEGVPLVRAYKDLSMTMAGYLGILFIIYFFPLKINVIQFTAGPCSIKSLVLNHLNSSSMSFDY